jgi:hypothetical protein
MALSGRLSESKFLGQQRDGEENPGIAAEARK